MRLKSSLIGNFLEGIIVLDELFLFEDVLSRDHEVKFPGLGTFLGRIIVLDETFLSGYFSGDHRDR